MCGFLKELQLCANLQTAEEIFGLLTAASLAIAVASVSAASVSATSVAAAISASIAASIAAVAAIAVRRHCWKGNA